MAKEKRPKKKTNTTLPSGYGIGEYSTEVIVIDFFDEDEDGQVYVYNSVAFPRTQAKELARAILDATEDDTTEE